MFRLSLRPVVSPLRVSLSSRWFATSSSSSSGGRRLRPSERASARQTNPPPSSRPAPASRSSANPTSTAKKQRASSIPKEPSVAERASASLAPEEVGEPEDGPDVADLHKQYLDSMLKSDEEDYKGPDDGDDLEFDDELIAQAEKMLRGEGGGNDSDDELMRDVYAGWEEELKKRNIDVDSLTLEQAKEVFGSDVVDDDFIRLKEKIERGEEIGDSELKSIMKDLQKLEFKYKSQLKDERARIARKDAGPTAAEMEEAMKRFREVDWQPDHPLDPSGRLTEEEVASLESELGSMQEFSEEFSKEFGTQVTAEEVRLLLTKTEEELAMEFIEGGKFAHLRDFKFGDDPDDDEQLAAAGEEEAEAEAETEDDFQARWEAATERSRNKGGNVQDAVFAEIFKPKPKPDVSQ